MNPVDRSLGKSRDIWRHISQTYGRISAVPLAVIQQFLPMKKKSTCIGRKETVAAREGGQD